MKTVLVVDGYNAINAIPRTRKELKKSLYSARKAILAICKEFAKTSGYIQDFCVVFDGETAHRSRDMMEIPHGGTHVFSATGGGDRKIIDTVKKFSRKGKVILASNDNYVRNNARAYGAALMDARDLLKKKSRKVSVDRKRIKKSLEERITRQYGKELGI